MVAYTKKPYITPEEYLKREKAIEEKNEYDDGVIVAMSGASPEHNAITFNLPAIMKPQMRGGNCRGFSNDQRVRILARNRYFYPDLTIVCGEPRYELLAGLRTLLNPTLVIEVLSSTTEARDRGEKLLSYQALASLSTYVLIAQDQPCIECYTRQPDGSWRYEAVTGVEGVLALPAIGCTLSLADVYDGVEFAPQPEDDEPPLE